MYTSILSKILNLFHRFEYIFRTPGLHIDLDFRKIIDIMSVTASVQNVRAISSLAKILSKKVV